MPGHRRLGLPSFACFVKATPVNGLGLGREIDISVFGGASDQGCEVIERRLVTVLCCLAVKGGDLLSLGLGKAHRTGSFLFTVRVFNLVVVRVREGIYLGILHTDDRSLTLAAGRRLCATGLGKSASAMLWGQSLLVVSWVNVGTVRCRGDASHDEGFAKHE